MRLALAALIAFGLSGCADGGSLIPLWDDDDTAQARQAEPAPPAAAPVETAQMAPVGDTAPPASQPLSVQTAQLPPLAQPAAIGDHCRRIAKQRSTDAAYAGEDEETQESVYNRTYSDCVAWDTRHAS